MDEPKMLASSLDEEQPPATEAELAAVKEALTQAMGEAEGEIPWMEGAKQRELVMPEHNPVNVLLTKLEKWLLMQPEWAVILAAPRKTRRQAINLISKRLLTIPNRYQNFGG